MRRAGLLVHEVLTHWRLASRLCSFRGLSLPRRRKVLLLVKVKVPLRAVVRKVGLAPTKRYEPRRQLLGTGATGAATGSAATGPKAEESVVSRPVKPKVPKESAERILDKPMKV